MKDIDYDFPDPYMEISLKNVKGKAFEAIIEYLKHYQTEKPKDIQMPLPGPDLKPPVLDQWDYDYISKFSYQECIDLINDANYLDIDELVTLVSVRLALEMINDEDEEIREKLRKEVSSCNLINKIILFKNNL